MRKKEKGKSCSGKMGKEHEKAEMKHVHALEKMHSKVKHKAKKG